MSDALRGAARAGEERRHARGRPLATPKDRRRLRIVRSTPPTRPDLSRTALPVHHPGAARFSDDDERLNAVEIVRIAKRCGLLDDLLHATSYEAGDGRKRVGGHWALAYLAFVQSGDVDIRPWLRATAA